MRCVRTFAAGAAIACCWPAAAGASQLLRLNGIGPLKLGMKRSAALATGWLADQSKGCELSSPRPTDYKLTGPSAPPKLSGTIEFGDGRITSMTFRRGVHTAAGVTVHKTTSATMVKDYKNAGFSAQAIFSTTFGGTFTTVSRHGHTVIQGFGTRKVVTELSIPSLPVCE